MNITPIDMQVIIPKATEVGKGQQQRDQQTVFQQQFGAVQFQDEAHRKLRQVKNTEKSEGKKIHEDGSKKNQQNGNNGKKNNKRTAQAIQGDDLSSLKNPVQGGHIDIKL